MPDAAGRLGKCYARGLQLAERDKNYDYAHEMFIECVLNDPGNLLYAEAMIKNLRAKFPDPNRKSAIRLGRSGSRALKKSMQNLAWDEVLRTAANRLKADPWDVTTLRVMAEACAALHYNEVELVYLKQALDANAKDLEVNRHCARSLARMGQFDQAIACWHRVEKLRGKDLEAARMISQLAEEKLRYPNGRPPSAQASTAVQDATAGGDAGSQSLPELSLTPRQVLERLLADDPQNLANHLELADLLIELEQYGAAQAALLRAVAACGEQLVLSEKLDIVRKLLAQQELAAEARLAGEHGRENEPFRMPWLELLFLAAALGLIPQFFPAAAAAMWQILDWRQWTRANWIGLNVVVMIMLLTVRFASEFRAAWRRRRRVTNRGR